MSEPITLWDKYGTPVTTYSPSWAHAQVIAGLLFEQPPAVPVLPVPRLVDVPGSDGDVTIEFDTPEAEQAFLQRVATGRARRKREGTGVL